MKEKVQVFGRFLSGMVMPNIGAFIAWGLITALFIETGWFPNEKLATLVGPMITYLLPLLIAYTGGKMVGGVRGGVMGTIAAMGIIVATTVPMFLGAMIIGPLAGWVIKQFDKVVEGKIPAGFEMLVNNFSIGIIGGIFTVLAYFGFAPIISGLTSAMAAGVQFFVDRNLLPLASILIEPAKILFLNNAINHGILSPMGIEQAKEVGKSLFFLMEANPGPGLGILLAYCFVGKGSAKSSAPGAVIIHFLGGIHEIYFPYVLMNPSLILAAIAGGASGIFTFNVLNVGLVAPASPGSIIAVLGMTPRGNYLGIIVGVLIAAVVSFIVSIPLIKIFGKDDSDIDAAKAKKDKMKAESKGISSSNTESNLANDYTNYEVKKIVFACDAGMGSSAMGATVLRKKLKAAGLESIIVEHASVSAIPLDAQIVVTHEALRERAAHSCPTAKLVLITNFMAAPQYDELVNDLIKK
jgi:PTS system mannitol-specific IIC component